MVLKSNAFSIASMSRILKVSRSGYYEWSNNSGSKRAEQDKQLITMIRTICKEGRNTYGIRSIKTILRGTV